MDPETKAHFERLNKKLTALLNQKPTETWVNSTWLTELTGWTNEKKRQAREQGLVKFKTLEEGKQSYLYLIESINPIFLKTKSQTHATGNYSHNDHTHIPTIVGGK